MAKDIQRNTIVALVGPPAPWRQLTIRAVLSLALAAGAVWLLSDRFAQIDVAALQLSFQQVSPAQWALAMALTALSFWAVGRYDEVLHRHFATGLPAHSTRRAGICAIAVSQTLGLGLISGAILRWRMLPGISLWQATRLTAAVAVSFLAGWAVVTSAATLVLPGAPFKPWAAAGITVAGAGAVLCLMAPRLPGVRFRWPNGTTLSQLLGLCAVDTLAAGSAFYCLVPADLALSFTALLPAFLLALGAGLALGTPGGMGAFEVTLLALVPLADSTPLVAAILAWRAVYFAAPALLGAAFAIRGPSTERSPTPTAVRLPHDRRAECGLVLQGQLQIDAIAGQGWMISRSHHLMTALFDPLCCRRKQQLDHALLGLQELSRSENRLPVVYKAGPRLAARARAIGASTRRIGWEGWIDPQTYRITASCRSGLRRKLRRAEAAGVTIRQTEGPSAPWAALAGIATRWAQIHGGERGFSMGRFDRAYLSRQRLYIALVQDRPIAFISLHTAPKEWALDLMRHDPDLPDGTMHSLVQAAIDDAANAGLRRLSLAAVPDTARVSNPDLAARIIAAFAPETAATGLYRFKSAFAPTWRPLYLIAPHRPGLVMAALGLWRAILRPAPRMPEIERDDEEYEFASLPASWHIARNED